MRGLEHRSNEELLRELGLFRLERGKFSRAFITLYSCHKGGCGEMWVSLFSQVSRTKENDLKLHQGRFRLGNRKNFFSKTVVKYWNRLPGETVESLSLQVLRNI